MDVRVAVAQTPAEGAGVTGTVGKSFGLIDRCCATRTLGINMYLGSTRIRHYPAKSLSNLRRSSAKTFGNARTLSLKIRRKPNSGDNPVILMMRKAFLFACPTT
jgi:hypothetical protein